MKISMMSKRSSMTMSSTMITSNKRLAASSGFLLTCFGLVLLLASIEARNQNQQQQKPKSTQPQISATFQPTAAAITTNSRQQTQPTVINPTSQHNQNYNQHFQQQHFHRPRLQQQNQAKFQPINGLNNQLTVCQLPEHLLGHTKCTNHQEKEFKRTAMAEFQSKLVESSGELRHWLDSYLQEFRAFSVDLILMAKNNTLNRIVAQQQSANVDLDQHHYEATRRLYDAMYAHLANYETSYFEPSEPLVTSSFGGSHQVQQQHNRDKADPMQQTRHAGSNSVADMNHEINIYFKRLHLIQTKRLLDQRLLHSSKGEVDLECLGANLHSQNQVETLLAELIAPNYPQQSLATSMDSIVPSSSAANAGSQLPAALAGEQMKLALSIKQSLEFARTLLSSLTLANEMFHNLTHQASEWMPHDSCHQALARMTVCPQCYPTEFTGSLIGISQTVNKPPPCESYCLNVLRGCMNDIYELNRFWQDHVNALERFKTNMIQMNNIENVMNSLDDRLVNFILKLNLQYNSTASATQQQQQQIQSSGEQANLLASKMAKLCLRSSQPSGAFRSTANLLAHLQRARPNGLRLPSSAQAATNQQHRGGSQSSSSQAAGRFGQMALRARSSPTLSLFNRLDGFVHRLQANRDFFADWPQRLCSKMRRTSGEHQQAALTGPQIAKSRNLMVATAAATIINSTAASNECWNGRDFGGYTKPLVPFGQAITSNHPEVPMATSDPINTMVLNFVAKLKDIGADLARKSTRSLYQSLNAAEARLQLVSSERQGDQSRNLPARAASDQLSPQQQQQQQPQNVSASSPQLILPSQLEILSSASANVDQDDEEPLETAAGDSQAPDGSASQEELDAGGQDEQANCDDEHDCDGDQTEDEEDEENANPKCSKIDCSDLFAENNAPLVNNGLVTSNNIVNNQAEPPNQSPTHHQQQINQQETQLDELQSSSISSTQTGFHRQQQPAIKYPAQSTSFPEVQTYNEIYPYINVQQPEYNTERQISSSANGSASSAGFGGHFLALHLFGLAAALTLLAVLRSLRRATMAAQQDSPTATMVVVA